MRGERKKEEASVKKKSERGSPSEEMMEIVTRIVLGDTYTKKSPSDGKTGSFWRPYAFGCLSAALLGAIALAFFI